MRAPPNAAAPQTSAGAISVDGADGYGAALAAISAAAGDAAINAVTGVNGEAVAPPTATPTATAQGTSATVADQTDQTRTVSNIAFSFMVRSAGLVVFGRQQAVGILCGTPLFRSTNNKTSIGLGHVRLFHSGAAGGQQRPRRSSAPPTMGGSSLEAASSGAGAGGGGGDDDADLDDDGAQADAAPQEDAAKKKSNNGALNNYFTYRAQGGDLSLHSWGSQCPASCSCGRPHVLKITGAPMSNSSWPLDEPWARMMSARFTPASKIWTDFPTLLADGCDNFHSTLLALCDLEEVAADDSSVDGMEESRDDEEHCAPAATKLRARPSGLNANVPPGVKLLVREAHAVNTDRGLKKLAIAAARRRNAHDARLRNEARGMLSARRLAPGETGGDADDGDGDEDAVRQRADEDERFADAAATIVGTMGSQRRARGSSTDANADADNNDDDYLRQGEAVDDFSALVTAAPMIPPRPGYDWHAEGLATLRAALGAVARARDAGAANGRASFTSASAATAATPPIDELAVASEVDDCFASLRAAAGVDAAADVSAVLGGTPARLSAFYAGAGLQGEIIPSTCLLKLNELQRAAAALVIVAELDRIAGQDQKPVHMLLHGQAGTGARAPSAQVSRIMPFSASLSEFRL